MRGRSMSVLLALLVVSLLRADDSAVTNLYPGVPAEIFVAPGGVTTLLFRGADKISAISAASPLVSYKYDRALNQIELAPTGRTAGAEINLNLRIGPNVYVLVAKVVTDVRAQFVRTFSPTAEIATDDEASLADSPPLKPNEVGLVEAARILGRAQSDPVFRAAHPSLRVESIGQISVWNDCLITLVDVAQFLDRDLLVFRVRWQNRTSDALHLDLSQYALAVQGRAIPIIARYQPSGIGTIVPPGATEIIFLAVQGQRLSRHNPWQLRLPPDAAEIGRRGPK